MSRVVSVGIVDATPEELYECVGDNQWRRYYDELFEEGGVRDVIGTNTY